MTISPTLTYDLQLCKSILPIPIMPISDLYSQTHHTYHKTIKETKQKKIKTIIKPTQQNHKQTKIKTMIIYINKDTLYDASCGNERVTNSVSLGTTLRLQLWFSVIFNSQFLTFFLDNHFWISDGDITHSYV